MNRNFVTSSSVFFFSFSSLLGLLSDARKMFCRICILSFTSSYFCGSVRRPKMEVVASSTFSYFYESLINRDSNSKLVLAPPAGRLFYCYCAALSTMADIIGNSLFRFLSIIYCFFYLRRLTANYSRLRSGSSCRGLIRAPLTCSVLLLVWLGASTILMSKMPFLYLVLPT